MPLKPLLFNALNCTTPVVILSGSSYLAYQKYGPKNIGEWLKKYGFWKIPNNKNDHYAAMLHENKDSVSELEIKGLNSNTSETTAIPQIKSRCDGFWSESWKDDLEKKIKKFCTYNPKTLYGLFRGSGKHKQFITSDEDYKILFAVYKNTSYLSSISGASTSDSNDTGKDKVKDFCEGKLKTNLENYFENKDQINKQLSVWCTKPGYKTVEEKIKKSEPDWTVISEDEESKTAFERWKYTPEVIAAIKKANGNDESLTAQTDNDSGGPKMKKWCQDGMNKKLYEEGVYMDEYKLIKSACRKAVQ